VPRRGWPRRNFFLMFDGGKTRMIGLPYGEKNCDDMLSRFHLIPERHEQTDRRTDRWTDLLYQYRASVCWRVIKIAYSSVVKKTSSSAVAKRPRDASCLSVVSFLLESKIPRAQFLSRVSIHSVDYFESSVECKTTLVSGSTGEGTCLDSRWHCTWSAWHGGRRTTKEARTVQSLS